MSINGSTKDEFYLYNPFYSLYKGGVAFNTKPLNQLVLNVISLGSFAKGVQYGFGSTKMIAYLLQALTI